MMLQCRAVSAGYVSSSPVLNEVSLELGQGEIVTLVGANGAGKSTLLKVISGLLRPTRGEISFMGRRVDACTPLQRLRLGLAHVPEGRQVFAGMTVAENLMLGAYAVPKPDRGAIRKRMHDLCEQYPVLRERMGDVVGNFSGGQQQILAIARGLMSAPRCLLLDEPSLGLSPKLVGELFQLIRQLREAGVSVLLAEQNARAALSVADRGYVMENGRVAMSGRGSELLASSEVAERYLGVGADARFSRERARGLANGMAMCIGADAET